MTEIDQKAIDAENNAPLFNIPPNTWRDNWIGARNGDSYSIGFWMGIYCSTSFSDADYDDRSLLASIARMRRI